MIRTDSGSLGDRQTHFTVRSASFLSRDFAPGSLVRVSVLAALPDGTFRVMVADRSLVAAGLKDASVGSTFSARIRFEDDAVVLTPVFDQLRESPEASAHPFTSLGLPETPVSVFLVSFFRSIGMRIDPALVMSLVKTAARFHGRELHAAEAAAILAERGIATDDDTVGRLLDLIEGRLDGYGEKSGGEGSSSGEGSDVSDGGRSFCAFINQKKGQALHWIVVPFRRNFAGRSCSGSVRFLLDSADHTTIETRVTFFEGIHCWDFSIAGKACSFTSKPGFSSVVFDKFVVYLKSLMINSGIETVSWHEPGSDPATVIKRVNLEI